MKRILLFILASMILSSCAPVLRQDLMNSGIFNLQISELRENPGLNRGKLYILGGIIVKTTVTNEGSLIEALYVPVDSRGYLKNIRASNGRFLAIYRGKTLLDPIIFRKEREVTIAGIFMETRTGKIDEIEYDYPLFEIKELYLWEEQKEYYYISPFYSPYYPYWWYDPWY